MSTIQLAPSTLAYQFESPGKYAMANYVDQNHDYNLLEFNAYKDQPIILYPNLNMCNFQTKNPKRRIMIL